MPLHEHMFFIRNFFPNMIFMGKSLKTYEAYFSFVIYDTTWAINLVLDDIMNLFVVDDIIKININIFLNNHICVTNIVIMKPNKTLWYKN